MILDKEKKVKFLESDVLKKSEDKKISNKKLYSLIKNENIVFMTDKTKERIFNCGTFLEFYSDVTLENIKLNSGNFCGNRFCPVCSANEARENAFILKILVDYLKVNYSFVFLTLTVPNCLGYDLDLTIQDMNKSFKRLSQSKNFKKAFKGYVRKLEVTYNPKRDDFHPHFHVLLVVNNSYFTDSRYYISQQKMLFMWQKATRNYNITQVDIRKFRQHNDNSIFEISKYFSKDSNYLYSIDIFKIFYSSLKGKQLITFNGLFKSALNKYKLGELDYLIEKIDIEFFYKIYSIWTSKGYNFDKILELSDEEKKNINIL